MRALIVPAAIMLFATTAAAAPAPETSWGRPGVSLQDYRLDATRCLNIVEHLDLRGTEPANALVLGTRRIDTIYARTGGEFGVGSQAPAGGAVQPGSEVMNVVEFTRPQHRINQIRDLMRFAMDTCLTELGYTRFRLTEAQQERLRHLRYGQPERHAYLHSLASDPEVLRTQAVAADAD
jgi:hypothetical protein